MQKKKDDNKFAISYTPVGKGTPFLQELAESIPTQFKATNKTSYIFSAIFTIVIAIGVINSLMPLMDLDLSFNANAGENESETFELKVNVGIPYSFFGSDADASEKITMSPFNLLIDLTLYIFLAYLIDVLLNFILTLKIMPSKEDLKKRPKEIKLQKRSISEKATEKIIEKVAEKVTGKKETTLKPQSQSTPTKQPPSTPSTSTPSPNTAPPNKSSPNKPSPNKPSPSSP